VLNRGVNFLGDPLADQTARHTTNDSAYGCSYGPGSAARDRAGSDCRTNSNRTARRSTCTGANWMSSGRVRNRIRIGRRIGRLHLINSFRIHDGLLRNVSKHLMPNGISDNSVNNWRAKTNDGESLTH
jgi:hypothetical protein